MGQCGEAKLVSRATLTSVNVAKTSVHMTILRESLQFLTHKSTKAEKGQESS